jgi:hypothetical protein
MNMCKDPELLPDPESLATALQEPLMKVFPPALLGRLVTIPYYPLSTRCWRASCACSSAASRSAWRRTIASRSATPTTR